MEIMNMSNGDNVIKNKGIVKPYLIKLSYRLPSIIGEVIEPLIIKASDNYNGALKHKETWVQHMRILLAHIFSCSLNTNKNEVEWVSFPIGNEELLKEIPQALSTKLGHKRGLDVLIELDMLKMMPHSTQNHKCTRLKISNKLYFSIREFLVKSESEFQIRSYQINGDFSPFDKIKKKGQRNTLERPKHDLSNFYDSHENVRQPKEVIDYYKERLEELAPVRVNIDTLIEYIKDLRRKITNDFEIKSLKSNITRMLQAKATLLNILDDYKVVSKNPFIVEYYPKYKVATVGGRLFEVSSGVQNLPHELKQKCLVGYNFDLVSSQLNILKFYATKYLGNSDIGFESIDDIASFLKIDRKNAKKVLYGTLFNAGTVSTSPENTVFKELCSFYDQEKSKAILTTWKKEGSELILKIKKLCEVFKTSRDFVITKKNGRKYLKNDVGILLDLSKFDNKQILSHIIQGFESSYLLNE